MRTGSTVNPSEVDPVALYKRIFGPEFKDPNAAAFKPDYLWFTDADIAHSRDNLRMLVARAKDGNRVLVSLMAPRTIQRTRTLQSRRRVFLQR